MGDPLEAAVQRRWCPKALQALELHREELDDLNAYPVAVYPVADGDTGTNLLLRGARGNSGIILSQLLAGLLGAPLQREQDSARGLATALSGAADAAYAAAARTAAGMGRDPAEVQRDGGEFAQLLPPLAGSR